jgi:hypothetical protein
LKNPEWSFLGHALARCVAAAVMIEQQMTISHPFLYIPWEVSFQKEGAAEILSSLYGKIFHNLLQFLVDGLR